MPFTPQVRALLIVLVLVCAAAAAGLMVLGRAQGSTDVAPATPVTPKRAPSTSPTRKPARGRSFAWAFAPDVFRGTQLPAQSTWTQVDKPLFLKHLGARGLTYAQWRAKHALRPAATDSTRQVGGATQPAQRLPVAIQQALAAKRVVVVSLYDPAAVIDDTAMREASAGAQLAGTAFVSVDVTKNEVDSLSARYGVIRDPAVLVLRPPGDLVFRIEGFADRDTVAQAAINAAS